jgi:hypothetical protein
VVILHNSELLARCGFILSSWRYCCVSCTLTLSFTSLPSLATLLFIPPTSLLLRVAKRRPSTYHGEHYGCRFCKCRLADAGARRRWPPGPFDDRYLSRSIYVVGYITFALYLFE